MSSTGLAIAMHDYVYPTRINWPDILGDLRDKGYSGYRVALLLGMEWSTVQGWLNDGKEPRHSSGTALLQLHTRYCGAEATQKRQNEAKVIA